MFRILLLMTVLGLAVLLALAQNDNSDSTRKDRKLRITKALRVDLPAEARQNQTQGSVLIEVTFQSDGTIGEVRCLNADTEETRKLIKYHVVQAAIDGARKIEFEPEIKDGTAITIMKKYEYTFSVY